MRNKICKDLEKVLKVKPFFDCVGGCGIDTSNGENPCMDAAGIWFKFCPFCGKKIVGEFNQLTGMWNWSEL